MTNQHTDLNKLPAIGPELPGQQVSLVPDGTMTPLSLNFTKITFQDFAFTSKMNRSTPKL